MTTDGCLSSDGRHLDFTSKDREQVENLISCFDLSCSIKMKKNRKEESSRKYYHVQWSDVVLYRFLESIGLTPNKSRTLGALHIPSEFFFDFLRGHFDGDGCFYSYKDARWKNSRMFYVVFISASIKHLYWLRSELRTALNIEGHIVSGSGITPSLRYAKREGRVVIESMYKSKGLSLSRKRLKIQEGLRIVGEPIGNLR